MNTLVGIVGTGIYIPEKRMTAMQIAEATGGAWTEQAVIEKLGIRQIVVPGEHDGTQEMGVKAAQDVLKNTGVDPKSIDLIICIGEEWKEYPLTTSGIYIQEQIGATNAWAIDVQQRCGTAVAAMGTKPLGTEQKVSLHCHRPSRLWQVEQATSQRYNDILCQHS